MYSQHLDASVEDVVLHGNTILSKYAHVLITCLDSVRNVASSATGSLVLQRFPGCAMFGKGILVPGEFLEEVHQSLGLFTGFDEVWCFTDVPAVEKPDNVSVLPPPGFNEEGPNPPTISWMIVSDCRLALGDGFGLNYITPEQETASALQILG